MKMTIQSCCYRALHGVTFVALVALTPLADANVGMENIGGAAKSMGRAGTAIAVGDDTSVMNTNPALLANIEEARADVSVEMMFPEFGFRNGVNDTDGNDPIYVIPSAGYAGRVNERLVLGIAMFNEGGTGTDYGVLNVDNGLLGTPFISGAEYSSQFGYMVMAPTASYQFADGFSIGISPQVGYAMLRMKMPFANPDLGRFGAADIDGDDTNVRVKIGVAYDADGRWGAGLAWTSKAGIDATGDVAITIPTGDLPGMPPESIMRGSSTMEIGWPSSVKLGAFYDAGSVGRFIAEVQRVNWSEYFDSIPVSFRRVAFNGMPMPDQAFRMNIGMEDQTAYRLAYEFPVSQAVMLRGGWAHGKNPIPSQGIIPIFNPIVEDHLTFGLGYEVGENFEFNAAVVRGFNNTVKGASSHSVSPDAANSETDMAFWSMAFQLSYKW